MSLISLLIALMAEKYLSSSLWQFNTYYRHYLALIQKSGVVKTPWQSSIVMLGFIAAPVFLLTLLMYWIDDTLLELVVATLVLIVCLGCVRARECYKSYLLSAFRGEGTTCEMHHLQLQQDMNQQDMSFGQLLVWLNYRYFIAIMIFFVLFGAPGALFYRLLTTVSEGQTIEAYEDNDEGKKLSSQWLFWVDWLPARIVAFGYMLVGHFSKAVATWVDNVLAFSMAPRDLLISVAEKSEDFMIDQDDCTAEPCLLVRLAKRTLLLCLAMVSILILTGVVN